MENSDTMAARVVRCPMCHCFLEEPHAALVYKCGGCSTTLRAKIRTSGTEEVNNMFSPSRSGSCSAVLTYYKDQKPCQDSIDQLSIDSPELQVDAALDFRVLEESGAAVYQGQDSIDQLSINSPELQVDAALVFEVLEEPHAPVYQGQDCIDQSKDVAKLQVDAAQIFQVPEEPSALDYQVSGRSTTGRYQRCHRKSGAQVYQESGCGTNLREKTHNGNTGEVTNASSTSRSGLPPRSRQYCRPILKGAPFIVCSSCFKLLQVPIDFAVSTNAVGKLQCGSCSSVLLYSYGEPARKKPYQDSDDQLSTDSSELQVDAALGFNNLIGGVTCCESYSKVEEPHYTPYKDAMAWLAVGKQRQKGLNHTFMQQAGHKLLGRDEIRQNIMEKILLDRNDESNCTVFCINGGSGFGKTSLLSVLYNDQELSYAFDKRIWIQMSDKLDVLMLFRKIFEFVINDHCSIMSTDLLQELLKEEITDEKFLLILDDANIEDQQFWNNVLEVLNAGAKGSVVIMATKSCAVATRRDVAYVHFLNPLSEENKLTIFQQYSGVGTNIQNTPDLVMVAKRIITRFGSNPLNLKAIGGLLCHSDTISLEKDMFEESVSMPLHLCHDALPVHLKLCLALCSLFPEGYIFDKHHMILLWISHGCVRPVEGREFEDVGTEYFNELLCRSFFQYSPSHDYEDNKFVMHELIYNVVASVSRDIYFKSDDLLSSIPENVLHCSLISSQFQTVELMHRTEQFKDLQTFLVLQPEWKPNSISLPTLKLVGLGDFFLKFTSLETLDLSHTETEELPGSIAGLRYLQYLSVNNTNIRDLPSELCRLRYLQTLEAKHCRFLTELPRDIKALVKLRHLDLTKELGYVDLPHGIGELTELQTLPVFHVSGDLSRCCISELGSLQSLRGCLCLSGLERVKTGSKAQEASLKDKHHLQDLTLQWHDDGIDIEDGDEDEDEDAADEQVLEGLEPHANLQAVLTIRGYEGSRFPAWMQGLSLPNLVTLTLDSCCNCTEFPAIAHLPLLKSLSVRKMYDVQRLSSNTDTHGVAKFPSLELLNLWEMYGLEELFSEESEVDYCPRLRKICISRCPDLKSLPPCARSLTELVLHCGQQLPDISELASLVSLKIEGFHGVRSFGLPAAAALKRLEIRSCKELVSVDGLSVALMTTVRSIKIAGCPKLVLPATSSLQTLRAAPTQADLAATQLLGAMEASTRRRLPWACFQHGTPVGCLQVHRLAQDDNEDPIPDFLRGLLPLGVWDGEKLIPTGMQTVEKSSPSGMAGTEMVGCSPTPIPADPPRDREADHRRPGRQAYVKAQ